ncbi:MAG: EamA family transporter [Acidobacteriaceae bacterium]
MSSSSPHSVPRFQIVIAFLCVYIFWGATYTAASVGVQLVPAFLLAGVRMVIGSSVLLTYCHLRGYQLIWDRRTMARVALVGVLLLCGGNVGLVWAERYIPSGFAALVLAVIPLYVALAESLLPNGERLQARGVIGIVIGFFGLGVLVWPKIRHGLRGERIEIIAIGVLLLGATSWAAGSILARRFKFPMHPLVAAGWEMVAASTANLTLGTLTSQWHHAVWNWQSWGAISYLVIFGSLGGFTAYIWLISHVPVAKVATYAYVNPIVAVILGAVVLHERLEGPEYIGMVVVLVAVALVTSSQTGAGRRAAEAEECAPLEA